MWRAESRHDQQSALAKSGSSEERGSAGQMFRKQRPFGGGAFEDNRRGAADGAAGEGGLGGRARECGDGVLSNRPEVAPADLDRVLNWTFKVPRVFCVRWMMRALADTEQSGKRRVAGIWQPEHQF